MIRTCSRAALCTLILVASLGQADCRGHQHARVLNSSDQDMMGSHEAGAETWKPLIEETVAKLLGRYFGSVETVSWTDEDSTPVRAVCFAGVENRSNEPLGDFREQIYEYIDAIVGAVSR